MTQQIKQKYFTIVEQNNDNIDFKNNFSKDILNFSLSFEINIKKSGVANVYIDIENNQSHLFFYDVCKKYDYLYINGAIDEFSNVYLTSALIDSDYDKTKILFIIILENWLLYLKVKSIQTSFFSKIKKMIKISFRKWYYALLKI
jgi:hypothetical protein